MIFKKCSMCQTKWYSRDELLSDNNIKIIGYQIFSSDLYDGLFLFNHLTCNTTLALKVDLFKDLINSTSDHSSLLYHTENCSGRCQKVAELDMCKKQCQGRPIRDVVQKIKQWSKSNLTK